MKKKEAVSILKFEAVFLIDKTFEKSLLFYNLDKIAFKQQFSFLSCVLKPSIRTLILFFGFLLKKIV